MDIQRETDILKIIMKGWPLELSERELNDWFTTIFKRHGIEILEDNEKADELNIHGEHGNENNPVMETKVDEKFIMDIGSEAYPQIPPGFIPPEGYQPTGTRYYMRLNWREQEIAINVDFEGNIIQREYIDNGRYHANEVQEFLVGWPKAVEQEQRGGRKPGMRPETREKYEHLLILLKSDKWKNRSYKEFLAIHGDKFSRSTIQRAVRWDNLGRP